MILLTPNSVHQNLSKRVCCHELCLALPSVFLFYSFFLLGQLTVHTINICRQIKLINRFPSETPLIAYLTKISFLQLFFL